MKSKRANTFRLIFIAILLSVGAAVLAFFAPSAAAQGCAMCYQSAAASGAQGRDVLRQGILILLLPGLSLFFGVFVLIYRRRNVARTSGEIRLNVRSRTEPV
jgi:hypothetical protein